MNVPLVDLSIQHAQIADEVDRSWHALIESSAFVLGDDVADFEREYAVFSGRSSCVGVASGTDALELALRGIDVGPGDEVVVPVNSFVASAVAVVRTGATPVFVDVDPEHLLVDPEAVEATLGPRTRAIMAVHLFGQMAPMRALAEVGRSSGCPLVEDAAQAHGATQNGTHPGSIGAAAATSFYPGKNLGAYGDAGAVLTDDQDLAQLVRQLRNYGSTTKYVHPIVGFNSRLDTLQAVVLRAKLRRLPTWNQQRAAAASFYDEVLAEHADVIQTPGVAPGNRHVWHLYVVRVSNRDAVVEALHERGIGRESTTPRRCTWRRPFVSSVVAVATSRLPSGRRTRSFPSPSTPGSRKLARREQPRR